MFASRKNKIDVKIGGALSMFNTALDNLKSANGDLHDLSLINSTKILDLEDEQEEIHESVAQNIKIIGNLNSLLGND